MDPASQPRDLLSGEFEYALVQIDGQAVITAKDLVESVLKRANIADYTVLGTVKGDALELMRFKHPFTDFDVPAITGDRNAGRGYRCGTYRRWPRS